MNDRIRQLAEQAGYTTDMFGVGHWDMPECKKFAELIINQCADIAQQHNKSPVAAPLAIGYVIREHFGVEE
jgi:hypothetical protein